MHLLVLVYLALLADFVLNGHRLSSSIHLWFTFELLFGLELLGYVRGARLLMGGMGYLMGLLGRCVNEVSLCW